MFLNFSAFQITLFYKLQIIHKAKVIFTFFMIYCEKFKQYKMPKIFYILSIIAVILSACKSSEKVTKKHSRINIDLLYKVWSIDSMIVGSNAVSGFDMGDPQYEFTRDGQRIKSFTSPPHKESVNYFIRNDSIHYKTEKALPSSLIAVLTDSTLVLKNDKAIWKLYIRK